jgi:hypothetical protein
VRLVTKWALVTKGGTWELVLALPEEEEKLKAPLLVFDDEGVGPAAQLTVPLQHVTVEEIQIVRSIRRLLLRDEEPDRVSSCGSKDPCV